MGNIRKHKFYSNAFPNMHCTLYYTQSIDTWPHLLLAHVNLNIQKPKIKRSFNVVWKLHKLFLSNKTSKCLILVNIGYENNKTKDSTIPSWLLPCTCLIKPCKCNANLKLDKIGWVDHYPLFHNLPSREGIKSGLHKSW